MNFLDFSTIVKTSRTRDIKLLSIEVNAKDFKGLKEDLSMTSYGLKQPGDLKPNEMQVLGVKVIGKLCECGAHPEDWE